MKTATVFGAGGFIGNAMVSRLKNEGYWVKGVDLKYPMYGESEADEFVIADLRDKGEVRAGININEIGRGDYVDELYQFAADMGGAGYIFTGENDFNIMSNSALININTCLMTRSRPIRVFYSSSACMYPSDVQASTDSLALSEAMAYPGNPDSEYGWEKLFSERLYEACYRNEDFSVRIGRFHNIFGENSCYNNGKEKYPAALCRKVAEAKDGDTITIWGDGKQTRSFLYIDECLEGVRRLMKSDYYQPINIGSSENISVEDLAKMVIEISGKNLTIKYDLTKPQGVRGRNSDNTLCKKILDWQPSEPLRNGMVRLYKWVDNQINKNGII